MNAVDVFDIVEVKRAVEDKQLTALALGVLVRLSVQPDLWNATQRVLAEHMLVSQATVSRALAELRTLGYAPDSRQVLLSEVVSSDLLLGVNQASDTNHVVAHRLARLAFEQPIKPDVATRRRGTVFVVVLGMIESRLNAGVSAATIECVLTSGDPIVWTLAGLQTAEAKCARSTSNTSGRDRSVDVDAIMAALASFGRARFADASATLTTAQVDACKRVSWSRLCGMSEFDARAALRGAL